MNRSKPLTLQEVTDYVFTIKGLLLRKGRQTACEIGDGNMNFVFRVTEHGHARNNSVIVKQALPYMRSVGARWPLTADRLRIEGDVLTTQHALCPGLVPILYHYDPDLSLLVMEDLASHMVLREGLLCHRRYPQFALQIGHFLATTLFFTSRFFLTEVEMAANRVQFANPAMVQITSDFIFTFPFIVHEMNRHHPLLDTRVHTIRNSTELLLALAILKEKFNTQAQALLHGDLHTGSIMVNETETKVIDPEFACYGPMGFDIGLLFAHLLLNVCSCTYENATSEEGALYQEYLLDTIKSIWETFQNEFHTLWQESPIMTQEETAGDAARVFAELLQDSLGFAGCEMIRRVIGTSHVQDLERIEDLPKRARAEDLALVIGQHLIVNRHHFLTIQDLVRYVHDRQATNGMDDPAVVAI